MFHLQFFKLALPRSLLHSLKSFTRSSNIFKRLQTFSQGLRSFTIFRTRALHSIPFTISKIPMRILFKLLVKRASNILLRPSSKNTLFLHSQPRTECFIRNFSQLTCIHSTLLFTIFKIPNAKSLTRSSNVFKLLSTSARVASCVPFKALPRNCQNIHQTNFFKQGSSQHLANCTNPFLPPPHLAL